MDIKEFSADKNDLFDNLTYEQQQGILEGLAEADLGDTVTHAEAVRLFEKWGLK